MATVNEYLDNVSSAQRAALEHIRTLVKQMVPDAEEVISYGVPTFKYNKRPLLYYAAFKDHLSIYPASDAMVEAIGKDLGKFRTGKGTFQFTEANPIPDRLIKEVINFRLAEISNS